MSGTKDCGCKHNLNGTQATKKKTPGSGTQWF